MWRGTDVMWSGFNVMWPGSEVMWHGTDVMWLPNMWVICTMVQCSAHSPTSFIQHRVFPLVSNWSWVKVLAKTLGSSLNQSATEQSGWRHTSVRAWSSTRRWVRLRNTLFGIPAVVVANVLVWECCHVYKSGVLPCSCYHGCRFLFVWLSLLTSAPPLSATEPGECVCPLAVCANCEWWGSDVRVWGVRVCGVRCEVYKMCSRVSALNWLTPTPISASISIPTSNQPNHLQRFLWKGHHRCSGHLRLWMYKRHCKLLLILY